MQIEKLRKGEILKLDGRSISSCNVPGQHSYDEIAILRQEPIGEIVMTETLTELCEMFNRPISSTLVRLFTRKLEEKCGKTEYVAAIEDFWVSIHPGLRFENFLHWIVNHVQEQRANIDMLGQSFKEFNDV